MSSFTFQDPLWLWAGLGLAFLAAFAVWREARRRRVLARFLGGRAAAARLAPRDPFRVPLERLLLLPAAALLLGGALAGPVWRVEPVEVPEPPPVRSLVLAIDVSASMQATDVGATRLSRATRIAGDILDAYPGDRIGLLLFAGSAYPLAPPTHDHDVIRYLLEGLAPTVASGVDPGTLLSVAIREAARLLPAEEEGRERVGERAIVLIGDGEAGEPDATIFRAARTAAADRIAIHTVGVGTARGAGMLLSRWTYQLGGQVVDRAGNPAVSSLREPVLRRIAEEGAGRYLPAADDPGLDALAGLFPRHTPSVPAAVEVPRWPEADLVAAFAAAALLLLLIEGARDARLRRSRWWTSRRRG